MKTLKKEFPKIKIIAEQHTQGTIEDARQRTVDMLTKHSKANAVFAVNHPSSVGAYKALQNEKLAGKICLVAFDSDPVLIYTFAGALTGLAAMIATSRASSAQPSAGIGLELDIIAAVIIGGCSPSGGRGTMTGTLIGTLLISFLRNGLTLLDITTNVQLVVIGLIIIFAVTADQFATRREA